MGQKQARSRSRNHPACYTMPFTTATFIKASQAEKFYRSDKQRGFLQEHTNAAGKQSGKVAGSMVAGLSWMC